MAKIGDIDVGEFPLLLAPMEDVSDPPFRALCKENGADKIYSFEKKKIRTLIRRPVIIPRFRSHLLILSIMLIPGFFLKIKIPRIKIAIFTNRNFINLSLSFNMLINFKRALSLLTILVKKVINFGNILIMNFAGV